MHCDAIYKLIWTQNYIWIRRKEKLRLRKGNFTTFVVIRVNI